MSERTTQQIIDDATDKRVRKLYVSEGVKLSLELSADLAHKVLALEQGKAKQVERQSDALASLLKSPPGSVAVAKGDLEKVSRIIATAGSRLVEASLPAFELRQAIEILKGYLK